MDRPCTTMNVYDDTRRKDGIMDLTIKLIDGARINAKQLETIQGAYLDTGVGCDVHPNTEDTVVVVPTGEEAWMGHTMDTDGDYLFPTVAVGPRGLTNVPETTKCNWRDV